MNFASPCARGLVVVATAGLVWFMTAAVPARADAPPSPAEQTELRRPGDPAIEDEPAETDVATPEPDAEDTPVVAEGPLRPKGAQPEVPPPPGVRADEWRRSYSGGVRWTKGDTSVTVSGTPGSVRLGGSITR